MTEELFVDTEIINALGEKIMSSDLELDLLIEVNMDSYADFHKKNKHKGVIICKMLHTRYIEAAKKQGLNVSNYPEELNYLERLN